MPPDILNYRLRSLTVATLQLLEPVERVRFPRDTVICRQGEPLDNLLFLESGLCSTLRYVPGGESIDVWVNGGPLGVLGLHSVLQQPESIFEYRARTNIVALRVPRDAIHHAMSVDTDFAQHIQKLVRDSASGIAQVAACRGLHNLEQRFCRQLLMLRASTGLNRIGLPRRVLIEIVPMSRGHLYTIARSLKGIVTIGSGVFEIHDAAALEARACGCFGTVYRDRQLAALVP